MFALGISQLRTLSSPMGLRLMPPARLAWRLVRLFPLGAFLVGFTATAEPVKHVAEARMMGTTYTIAAYGDDRSRLTAAVDAAFEEGIRIDRLISNYKEDSELSRVNREAASGPVSISQELTELLARCVRYSRESEGAFDITVGPLMRVWGFYRGQGEMPSWWRLWWVRRQIGYEHVALDEGGRTVEFLNSGLELDPGGIGKGYAVDRMAEVLRDFGVESAFVDAGKSSQYALGSPPSEPRGWKVAIRSPESAAVAAAEVFLRNESLSTSGGYEKFFEVDGKRYAHIMDPRTGQPAEGVAAVSVIAPKTLDSEAWTKPYFVNGLDWTREHANSEFRVFFCPENEECQWLEK